MRCSCGRENRRDVKRAPNAASGCSSAWTRGAWPSTPRRWLALLARPGPGLPLRPRPGRAAVPAATPPPRDGPRPPPLHLAVTPPEYDDMGKLLDTLGSGYRHTKIAMNDLLDAERLRKYDVVFLTCGGAPRDWLGKRTGAGQRDVGGRLPRAAEDRPAAPHRRLRRFVDAGGTLYASDWQFGLVAIAFPEFVDLAKTPRRRRADRPRRGDRSGLAKAAGQGHRSELRRPGWQPAAFHQAKVDDLYPRQLSNGVRRPARPPPCWCNSLSAKAT